MSSSAIVTLALSVLFTSEIVKRVCLRDSCQSLAASGGQTLKINLADYEALARALQGKVFACAYSIILNMIFSGCRGGSSRTWFSLAKLLCHYLKKVHPQNV
jgi:hypothetical protein